ncbi:MAG: hypothetical protein PHS99_08625 [Candidatus Marinimicrobia bacterium]|nr:hypothetical protein [Candidatus Neomarinimicrobiota bacterium]
MTELEELQNRIKIFLRDKNKRGFRVFEGYSPTEMDQILYHPFAITSPIKFQKLSYADYQKIPILNQIKYLAKIIQDKGTLTLTAKGYLPTKIVADLYHQGFLKEFFIEEEYVKLIKEMDSMTVSLTRILLDLSRITKKRYGKLSLTKMGEKLLTDDDMLLRKILETFVNNFNWAYFDGYGENYIGQLGFGFSLILLSKYGHEKRPDTFYAEKYFKAFPRLIEGIELKYDSAEDIAKRCYSLRTFDRFLDYFGLIDIDQQGDIKNSVKNITVTDLFDRLITIVPPSLENF